MMSVAIAASAAHQVSMLGPKGPEHRLSPYAAKPLAGRLPRRPSRARLRPGGIREGPRESQSKRRGVAVPLSAGDRPTSRARTTTQNEEKAFETPALARGRRPVGDPKGARNQPGAGRGSWRPSPAPTAQSTASARRAPGAPAGRPGRAGRRPPGGPCCRRVWGPSPLASRQERQRGRAGWDGAVARAASL